MQNISTYWVFALEILSKAVMIEGGFLSYCEALYKYWQLRKEAYPGEWYQVCIHSQLVEYWEIALAFNIHVKLGAH